jgi:hypothetical protein
VLADARRSYATTARATKPTRTVKKDVKKAAAKKPAPKKATSTKKAVAKKPAPRKKAVAKKAKPKKKAVVKPKGRLRRAKKVLTPEEQEKETIKELKAKALAKGPSISHYRALDMLLRETMSGVKNAADGQQVFTETNAKSKDWTPAEKEHYHHLANEATAASQKTYNDWVRSHTPDQIRIANNARAQLKVKLAGKYKSMPAYTKPIKDDRIPKHPLNPFGRFLSERWASGDMKSMSVGDAGKLIGNEWKSLSAGEKKKYEDAFNTELEAYYAEFKRTYGYESKNAS